MAKPSRPPLRFGDDPLLWASWLYYEEGLTQSEIAEQIGASRPTVNAYLADARAQGIVNISISGERLRSVTIARALEDHFGLDACLTIPGEGGQRPVIDRLGAAAAQALPSLVHSGDVIAITWGRTMLALAQSARALDVMDLTVVQATGGTTAAITYTPDACATRLADNLGARFVPISAPAIVSTAESKRILLQEPVIAEQMQTLARANVVFFGVSSLRPDSTLHTSGFFDRHLQQQGHYTNAVGSIAGRFVDANGLPQHGPLSDRTIGIELASLQRVTKRVLVAGGVDKVPAILAALRGGFVSTLVIDAATGEGILRAENVDWGGKQPRGKTLAADRPLPTRTRVKKFLNTPRDAVNEAIEGAIAAYPNHLAPIGGNLRALAAKDLPQTGKVGIVIGGGSGHEPSFLGFVGRGLADAVAVGNVFASPPPDRILTCTHAADQGAGVLYIYGNYSGDMMNFDMAADLATQGGIAVRSVRTTDDLASATPQDREARRGTAGNIFVTKVAGAASARMLPLEDCTRLAQKANAACHTIGVALEPCSMPDTLRPSFRLGEDDLEFGVGIHGEPGVARMPMLTADRVVDRICDRIFAEMAPQPGQSLAVLINSLGGTPMMELFILNRRLHQRLAAKSLEVKLSLCGHYCTSLNMVGASITLMQLDDELTSLLQDPCDGFAWTRA